MKAKQLVLVFAMVLLFGLGLSHAATISILGPTEVNKFTDPQFTIGVVINDIGPLDNLDFWNLGLALSPETGAKFVSAFADDTDPAYVYYDGRSDGFNFNVDNPYRILLSDLAKLDQAPTDVVDKLLVSVVTDISDADVRDWFSIDIFVDSDWTFFGDTDFDIDFDIVLLEDYQFHVIPIPGTLLLLGSGLIGLIGLRRRSKTA